MDVAISRNGIRIRLTEERWFHIGETRDEMAGPYDEVLSVIEVPDYIIQGYREALVALRPIGKKKFIAVVYKETGKKDGFVITAFMTSKVRIEKEVVLGEKKS